VLILENPGLPGSSLITGALYAGLQLLLPGEVAPSHRHTQSALRFIVEGAGAYTAVDGERTTMAPGDFDHHAVVDLARPRQRGRRCGGVARRPRHPDSSRCTTRRFAERYPEAVQPVTRPKATPTRAGPNLALLGHAHPTRTSPMFNYRYAKCRAALARLHADGVCDPAARRADALRQSRDRWLGDAHAGHLPPAPARGLSRPAAPVDRRTVYCCVEGARRAPHRRTTCSNGGRATSSSRRRGRRARSRPPPNADTVRVLRPARAGGRSGLLREENDFRSQRLKQVKGSCRSSSAPDGSASSRRRT